MLKLAAKLSVFVILFLLVLVINSNTSQAQEPQYHAAFGIDEYQIDTDGDGLTDHEERAVYQTDWKNADTDGDGFDDYTEVINGYSPKHPELRMDEVDTDNDGLNDAWEIKLGTNLMVRDTDGDGHLDGSEVFHGYSPISTATTTVDKLIEVSTETYRLAYYFDGILLNNIPVSTGKPATLTPEGDFEVLARVPVKWYGGPGYSYSYPNTKWNLHFTTDYWRYYIHGAYWHNNFGIAGVSGGCINVRYEDMEDLYNFANVGTRVIVS